MLKGSGFWSISRNRSPFWNLQKSASGRLRRAAAGRIEGTALRESMEMLSEEKAHVSSRDVGNSKMNVAGNETIEYENFIQDVKDMIFSGIQKSYDFSHREMTLAYWKIGQSIAEEREKFGEKSLHKKNFLEKISQRVGSTIWRQLFRKKFA